MPPAKTTWGSRSAAASVVLKKSVAVLDGFFLRLVKASLPLIFS